MSDTENTRSAFVLASTMHGMMILNRLDYRNTSDGKACGMAVELLEFGSHEIEDISLLISIIMARRAHCGDGVVVIDGGANIGTHAVSLGRPMSGWGELIAFEPQKHSFYALCGNIALNNVWAASARQCAIGSHSGAMRIPKLNPRLPANFGGLALKPDLPQAPGQTVDFSPEAMDDVPVQAIDHLRLPRLDLLKLDLEGMEPDALDGAQGTIERCRPVVFAEISAGKQAILSRLPGYVEICAAQSMLCVHQDDPIRGMFKMGPHE